MNAILLLFYSLINYTLPGVNEQGDRIYYTGANSLGLGGVSVIFENGDNPAGTGLNDKITLYLNGLIYSGIEKRGLRVYDSYGNNVGVSTIANNHINNVAPGLMALTLPLKFLRLGLRYQPLWDFNYLYYYEYRDDFYQITEIVKDHYNGGVSSAAPIISVSSHFLKIGVEEDFLYGKIEREFKRLFPEGRDSIVNIAHHLDGRRIKWGLLLTPFINLTLGYSYADRYKLKSDSGSFIYPGSHTTGIAFQPPNRIPTKFLIEIGYEKWDRPIYVYKFGIEHTIIFKHKLRYGFCLFPDYREPSIWTTNLTLGFGTNIKNYCFDIGFGYGKRNYANTDFGGLDISEKYLFDETLCHLLFSLGLSF